MMNIYQTVSAVMSELGAIGKDSKNQQQGFMYRAVSYTHLTLPTTSRV